MMLLKNLVATTLLLSAKLVLRFYVGGIMVLDSFVIAKHSASIAWQCLSIAM